MDKDSKISFLSFSDLTTSLEMNFDNIPNGMISGLSGDMLDFVTEVSNERYVYELDQRFFNELEAIENVDSTLSKEQEEELIQLEKSAQPASTQNQTQKWVKKFKDFLTEKKLCPNFETVPMQMLNDYLRLFYSSLKKNDGTFYAPASLICIRSALHRHLQSPEINSTLNILTDDGFIRANNVLKAMVKQYLNSSQEATRGFDRITDSDMEKLLMYFSQEPQGLKTLQEECIFNILLHFQLRGRENLRAFTKDSFEFSEFQDGREFVSIKVPMLQKNVKASLNRKEFENLKSAKMVSQPNGRCPVKILKQYISKLPEKTKDNTLFPGMKKDSFSEMTVLGKDTLGNLMGTLSMKARLSKRYTNHCLRVTGINLMHESGMNNTDIASITGHKNDRSIERYIRKSDVNVIRASNILSGNRENTTTTCGSLVKTIKRTLNDGDESWEVIHKNQTSTEEACKTKIIKLKGTFENCNFQF